MTLNVKYVVAPIDNARHNVSFVCRRHFTQVLIKELGLNNINNLTSTYMEAIKPVDKIA